jgi:hypothetical protein
MDAAATIERLKILAGKERDGGPLTASIDRLLGEPALIELANLATIWRLGMRDEAVARIRGLPESESSDRQLVDTELSVRLCSMLDGLGIHTVGELARKRREGGSIPGFAATALTECDLIVHKYAEDSE